jgi:hypothetical protein
LSEATPIGIPPQVLGTGQAASGNQVRASIARAAAATGIDFDYLLAQAKIESSLNPSAKAPTSSAAGLYQFTGGTWLETLDRHGAEHGLGWAGDMIQGGRVGDRGARAQIMALRYDADASALMAAELASDNKASLTGQLGREPDPSELYLAHFLGIGGAGKFLSALQTDPARSAASLLPDAANANRGIFFGAGGAPRSVAQVMDVLRAKVATAMDGSGSVDFASALAAAGDAAPSGFAPPPEFRAAQAASGFAPLSASAPSAPIQPRPSMAETLRDTFGLAHGDASSAPGFVKAAYGTLRSFGL